MPHSSTAAISGRHRGYAANTSICPFHGRHELPHNPLLAQQAQNHGAPQTTVRISRLQISVHSARAGIAALILLWLVWGYTWVVMKEGLRFADPFDYAALRAPGKTLVLGLFQTVLFNALVSWALVSGAASKTAVLVYTMPFWTLLFAWPVLGERIRGAQWLAVTLAFSGLMLVLEPWNLGGTLASKALAVLTGVAWAVSAILAKKWRAELGSDVLLLTAWQMLFGGLLLTVIAMFLPSPPVNWTPYFWFLLIYATLLGTVAGWVLWLIVLQRLPAGTAGLSIMGIPAIGVLCSQLQLGERPAPVETAGMILIGISLAVLSWPSRGAKNRE